MAQAPNIDGVLIQWGDRLFYPGNRIVKVQPPPKLSGNAARQHAAAIRARIEATVVRRMPQVMVKVTGGGRGMKAIAAHFRYISKNGRLGIEDELGHETRGKEGLIEIADDWRYGGTLIDDVAEPGHHREAFNIMLSMPPGIDPLTVQRAAREFAKAELADHKYVMVLHDHQANPHVHLSVRAESKNGKRLNPRKADLHRWRETFAEKLRAWGIECQATRQGGARARPAGRAALAYQSRRRRAPAQRPAPRVPPPRAQRAATRGSPSLARNCSRARRFHQPSRSRSRRLDHRLRAQPAGARRSRPRAIAIAPRPSRAPARCR